MNNKSKEIQIRRNYLHDLKQQIKLSNLCSEEEIRRKSESDAEKFMEHEETLKEFMILSKFKEISSKKHFGECFEVMEKLGEGAHSSVYRCIQKHTGIFYAAKLFKKMDPELFVAVKQTYQIMKKLHHPSIIQGKYLFISYNESSCQLITEYFKCKDLRFYLDKKNTQRPLVEGKAAAIIDALLQVLEYLNEEGVCHRDIKPQNILYDEETGNIKLIDFQLARMHRYSHQKVQLWTNTGSLHYRAPQSFLGGYNQMIDMWASGIIAYQMLIGRLPFRARYDREIIQKICSQELDFSDSKLSGFAQDFLKKILCKNPTKRLKPKQARSHPFLLKNTKLTKSLLSIENSSSFSISTPVEDSEQQDIEQQKYFYDQSRQFCFLECLAQDIGVRIVE